jgi:hypothetical protein
MLALISLTPILYNARMLRDLSERRERRIKHHLDYLNLRQRTGGDVLGSDARLDEEFDEQAIQSDGQLVAAIQQYLLLPLPAAVERARRAVQAGGARPVDDAISPGSHANRIQLAEQLGDLDRLIPRIQICLGLPRTALFDVADEMDSLAEGLRRFDRRLDESVRALGTDLGSPARSLPPPAPPAEALDDFRRGAWFCAAVIRYRPGGSRTKITLQQLSREADRGEFGKDGYKSLGERGIRWYSFSRVCSATAFANHAVYFKKAAAEGFEVPPREYVRRKGKRRR